MAKQTKAFDGKAVLMNFSGNVGKTTIARQLLLPRMPNAIYISVESINSDDGDGSNVRGRDWGQLSEELMLIDSAVVDVGASNVEDFLRLMDQYRGSHEEFDLFVIPAVPDSKQTRDTLATIDSLVAMGVPADKIRVVFNRLEAGDSVEDKFAPILHHAAATKAFIANPAAWVEYSEIYTKMRLHHTDLGDILADTTNWREKLREAKASADEAGQYEAMGRISLRRLAVSAMENLDAAYAALMAK